MKNFNFVAKYVQRILSLHKISEKYNEQKVFQKLFLKISQYSEENTYVGISFSIKMQAFRPAALLKRDSNTWVFLRILRIFKNTYFEEHLWTAASESFPWTFSYMNKQHRKRRRRFLKNKTKQNHSKTQLYEKKLAFSWCSLSFCFSLFLHCTSGGVCAT